MGEGVLGPWGAVGVRLVLGLMNSSEVGVASVPTEDPVGCGGVEKGSVEPPGTLLEVDWVSSEVTGGVTVVGIPEAIEKSGLDTVLDPLETVLGLCCPSEELSVTFKVVPVGWSELAVLLSVEAGGGCEMFAGPKGWREVLVATVVASWSSPRVGLSLF